MLWALHYSADGSHEVTFDHVRPPALLLPARAACVQRAACFDADARFLQAGGKPQTTSLRPRDPNATAAAMRSRAPSSTRPAGVSLSSLLQTRAESANPQLAGGAALSPLPDIDSADMNNPLAAAEYAYSIYNYFRRVEPKFRVAPDYMKSQVCRRAGPSAAELGECTAAQCSNS